jgi:hypothetical protein
MDRGGGPVLGKLSMSDVAEKVAPESVEFAVPQVRQQASSKKNFRFPMRRSERKQSKAEMEATRLMIADFIEKKGVTVCPPGYASGAVQTQYDFI